MKKKFLSITLAGTLLLMSGCTENSMPSIAETTQTTTEAVTDATTGNLKLVTSDSPPENTTSPEGYTTPYIDYFTPEGKHVYEYYVTE